MVVNQGKVTAGETGIAALIENRNIEFTNYTQTRNTHALASVAADDVTQTTDVTQSNVISNSIDVANSGEVRGRNIGIAAEIINEATEMANVAELESSSDGSVAGDLTQRTNINQINRIENKIKITNTGKISGGTLGIYAAIPEPELLAVDIASVAFDTSAPNVNQSNEVDSSIVIDNAGNIGADSLFAIDTIGARTTIDNRSGGAIKGYVDLTDESDAFFNEAGGTFQARKQSDFGGGSDLFRNMGEVHTAEKLATEKTSFVNLERFENSGLVSLIDGRVGDRFTISNTVGGTDLDYVASKGARLGVDAFLGKPGSTADNFVIEGNASGRTLLQVHNTNQGGGAYNPRGIPVAFVDGEVKSSAFYLDKPVDAGLFDYDLFFVPTGSGFFELRSHPGGGSHVLPHVVTVPWTRAELDQRCLA